MFSTSWSIYLSCLKISWNISSVKYVKRDCDFISVALKQILLSQKSWRKSINETKNIRITDQSKLIASIIYLFMALLFLVNYVQVYCALFKMFRLTRNSSSHVLRGEISCVKLKCLMRQTQFISAFFAIFILKRSSIFCRGSANRCLMIARSKNIFKLLYQSKWLILSTTCILCHNQSLNNVERHPSSSNCTLD